MGYLVPFPIRTLTILLKRFMYDLVSAEMPIHCHSESFPIHRTLSAFRIILSNRCTRYSFAKDPYVGRPQSPILPCFAAAWFEECR